MGCARKARAERAGTVAGSEGLLGRAKTANLNIKRRGGSVLEANRVPFEDVTAGLTTKSDKIRGLARAG